MPDVCFATGDRQAPGYLARPPAGPAPWPGVVVIHEALGLNADIRAKTDQLAANGYLALAPDLYDGRHWTRCVLAAIRQVRAASGPAFTTLDSAREHLAGLADCSGKVGVIGFCLGGGFAVLCAPRAGFDAAAVNYGEVPRDADDVLAGSCPVVGSYGARDLMGTGHPDRLERALTKAQVAHDVKIYPDAGHRFLSESSGKGAVYYRIVRMTFRPDDAADAWRRIHAFFGEHLAA